MTRHFAHKITMAGLLTLLLAGCAFQLIYPRLPFLIGWQIDSYLDLNGEQEDWLDARLKAHLSSHRLTQLPRYIDYTQQLSDALAAVSLNEATLLQLEQASRLLYLDLMLQFSDDAVQLLSGLSDSQVERVLQRQAKERRKADKKYAESDDVERAEKRFDDAIDNMDDLLGRLDNEQKILIKSFVDQRPDLYQLGKATRDRWQQRIGEMLQNRQQQSWLREQLLLMLQTPESLRDDVYAEAYQRNEQLRRQMYVALFPTLTTKQRQHLQEEITAWREDFAALAEKTAE